MGFRLRGEPVIKRLRPCLPGTSTTKGMINSTDIDKLVLGSSLGANTVHLAVGTTADIAKAANIVGIVASVPNACTADSTTLIYVQPLTPWDEIEADYSTSVAGTTSALTLTSNIGYFFGWSNTTTVAGGATIDPSTCGTAAGTTSGLFFKMTGFDNTRKKIYGTINSSHLMLS